MDQRLKAAATALPPLSSTSDEEDATARGLAAKPRALTLHRLGQAVGTGAKARRAAQAAAAAEEEEREEAEAEVDAEAEAMSRAQAGTSKRPGAAADPARRGRVELPGADRGAVPEAHSLALAAEMADSYGAAGPWARSQWADEAGGRRPEEPGVEADDAEAGAAPSSELGGEQEPAQADAAPRAASVRSVASDADEGAWGGVREGVSASFAAPQTEEQGGSAAWRAGEDDGSEGSPAPTSAGLVMDHREASPWRRQRLREDALAAAGGRPPPDSLLDDASQGYALGEEATRSDERSGSSAGSDAGGSSRGTGGIAGAASASPLAESQWETHGDDAAAREGGGAEGSDSPGGADGASGGAAEADDAVAGDAEGQGGDARRPAAAEPASPVVAGAELAADGDGSDTGSGPDAPHASDEGGEPQSPLAAGQPPLTSEALPFTARSAASPFDRRPRARPSEVFRSAIAGRNEELEQTTPSAGPASRPASAGRVVEAGRRVTFADSPAGPAGAVGLGEPPEGAWPETPVAGKRSPGFVRGPGFAFTEPGEEATPVGGGAAGATAGGRQGAEEEEEEEEEEADDDDDVAGMLASLAEASQAPDDGLSLEAPATVDGSQLVQVVDVLAARLGVTAAVVASALAEAAAAARSSGRPQQSVQQLLVAAVAALSR